EEIEAQNVGMPREGILFVGDRGTIMAGFHGQNPQLFAKGKSEALRLEASEGSRRGRHSTWFEAVKGGEPSPGSFLSAGPITDAVNLGTVALRAGKKVLFDSEKMEITNAADASKYLYREYRDGWEL
ncbi:MAG: gfo/Idh/MocA family oxidoreductase, partial [Planctomycetota bacterium]